MVLGLFVALFLMGCQSTSKWIDRNERFISGLWQATYQKPEELSSATWELLKYWDLESPYLADPEATLVQAQELFRAQPDREWASALAELCVVSARKHHGTSRPAGENPLVTERYLDAVSYAYYYLFSEDAPSVFDRRNSQVCGIYNAGCEHLLAAAKNGGRLHPHTGCAVTIKNDQLTSQIIRRGFCWAADEFDELDLASNYYAPDQIQVQQEFGLGVPLIGVRHHQGTQAKRELLLGSKHPFAVTAFFRPNLRRLTLNVPEHLQLQSADAHSMGTLELIDPLWKEEIPVARQRVPLEMDLAAPMTYILAQNKRTKVELGGFLEPDSIEEVSRLYTFEAYQPGKIPVVMVHGLLSGPAGWTEMFRELWSKPEIRERYHFWFFLYPTGEPFLTSARRLREQLTTLHDAYAEDDPAYEQMVLLGHSMGGLISKLQVTESGTALWDLVSNRELEGIRTDDETRERLRQTFFFEPLPFVTRVVYLGTPHHGSRISSAPLGRFGSYLVQIPRKLRISQQELVRDNPGAFKSLYRNGVPNSVDLLAPKHPVLEAMNQLPYGPGVVKNNIIGDANLAAYKYSVVNDFLTNGAAREEGDGVVPVASARIPDVDSEIAIPATHGKVHRHALATREVERILALHGANVEEKYPIQRIRANTTATRGDAEDRPAFTPMKATGVRHAGFSEPDLK